MFPLGASWDMARDKFRFIFLERSSVLPNIVAAERKPANRDRPQREQVFAEISLLAALIVPALQAMGVTVNAWIASVLWVGVLFVISLKIWHDAHWRPWVRLVCMFFALAGCGVLVYRSFAGPIAPMSSAEVEFFDAHRIPARKIKFVDLAHFPEAFAKELPTIKPIVYPVCLLNGRIYMNVIVRNPSEIDMRNATIYVLSNVPIKGESQGAEKFSDTEVNWDMRTVRKFSAMGTEVLCTISFEPPSSGPIPTYFMVNVESDNSAPSSSIQLFRFITAPGDVR